MLAALIPFAIKAIGSILGGNSARKAGENAAEEEIRQSKEVARGIRRRAGEARGAATASFAASGVDVGSGSAADADRRIIFDSEYDVMNALLTGKVRARAARAAGKNAQTASYFDAAGSAYSGWLTAKDAKKGGS